ncbi:MAG TPA: hypothetical protein ENI87_08590, partial [bacterium]|nr:hypothetical protein [bacterium]
MSSGAGAPDRGPRWLPWVCLGLLVLPFHPLWVDHEQVRRGLLLLLGGAALLGYRRLPHCRGERMAVAFVLALVLCAVVQLAVQAVFRADDAVFSFQPWEAAYRIAHFAALLVVVRLGAA